MRLAEKNISFVRRLEQDGITYCWFVGMKSNRVSDSREYVNWENGKTVVKKYPLHWLPKSVLNFVLYHTETLTTDGGETGFKMYTIS